MSRFFSHIKSQPEKRILKEYTDTIVNVIAEVILDQIQDDIGFIHEMESPLATLAYLSIPRNSDFL